jgi:hypothetical protein
MSTVCGWHGERNNNGSRERVNESRERNEVERPDESSPSLSGRFGYACAPGLHERPSATFLTLADLRCRIFPCELLFCNVAVKKMVHSLSE